MCCCCKGLSEANQKHVQEVAEQEPQGLVLQMDMEEDLQKVSAALKEIRRRAALLYEHQRHR